MRWRYADVMVVDGNKIERLDWLREKHYID
jgi:hypothetical protein